MTEVHEVDSFVGGGRLVRHGTEKDKHLFITNTTEYARTNAIVIVFVGWFYFLHPSETTETIIHDFDVRWTTENYVIHVIA